MKTIFSQSGKLPKVIEKEREWGKTGQKAINCREVPPSDKTGKSGSSPRPIFPKSETKSSERSSSHPKSLSVSLRLCHQFIMIEEQNKIVFK